MKKKNCEHPHQAPHIDREDVKWSRTIFLAGDVNSESSLEFVNKIHKYMNDDEEGKITIMINSNGGSVTDLFSMYDVIRAARKKCVIRTICFGTAYSAASLILAAGTKGHRYAYPSASVMIHGLQLNGFIHGHIEDTLRLVEDATRTYEELLSRYAYELGKSNKDDGSEVPPSKKQMNKTIASLKEMMARDAYLPVNGALDLGFIDHVGVPRLEEEHFDMGDDIVGMDDLSEEELDGIIEAVESAKRRLTGTTEANTKDTDSRWEVIDV